MEIERGFNPSCSEFTTYVDIDTRRWDEVKEDVMEFLQILSDCSGGKPEPEEAEKIKQFLRKYKLNLWELTKTTTCYKMFRDQFRKKDYGQDFFDQRYGDFGYHFSKIFGRNVIHIDGYTGDHGQMIDLILETIGLRIECEE